MVGLFGLGSKPKTFEFRCSGCGQMHRGSPSFSYYRPSALFEVPEEERAARVWQTDDACVIQPANPEGGEKPSYWLRTVLNIPINDVDDPFCWGVWVSQSEESFFQYEAAEGENRPGLGSFGWLQVNLPHYNAEGSDVAALECDVHWRAEGWRPTVQLWESDHPLSVDQRNGITWEKAIQIATRAMHEYQTG